MTQECKVFSYFPGYFHHGKAKSWKDVGMWDDGQRKAKWSLDKNQRYHNASRLGPFTQHGCSSGDNCTIRLPLLVLVCWGWITFSAGKSSGEAVLNWLSLVTAGRQGYVVFQWPGHILESLEALREGCSHHQTASPFPGVEQICALFFFFTDLCFSVAPVQEFQSNKEM